MRSPLRWMLALTALTTLAGYAAAGTGPDRRPDHAGRPDERTGPTQWRDADRANAATRRRDAQRRQAQRSARADRRRAERSERGPSDRSVANEHRRDGQRVAADAKARELPGPDPRRARLRRRLAEIDGLRDEALASGDLGLLDEADRLEAEARAEADTPPRDTLVDAPAPTDETTTEPAEHRGPFDRGYGRLTAAQARGEAGPLSEMTPPEEWGPGYGRLTAAERHARNEARRLARQEPPATEPDPTDPGTTEPAPTDPPATEAPGDEEASDPDGVGSAETSEALLDQ